MVSGDNPQPEQENEPTDTAAEANPSVPAEAVPTLNRAARRAQAQHKQSGAGSKSGFQGGKGTGFTPRSGGSPMKARIPRTGHK